MFDPQERSQRITFLAGLFVASLLLCGVASAAPSISLSKKSGPPTSKILVSGRGFEPNVKVDILFDTKDKAFVVTNGKGRFNDARIYAPRGARPGEHRVTALQRNNNKRAQKPFLIQTDWSQFGFDPDGNRLNPFENVLNPRTVANLQLKWKYVTGGFVDSSPVVDHGIVYIASDKVYALDARTGTKLWNDPIFSVSPAVVDGVAYVSSYNDGKLYALNAKTGTELWGYPVSVGSPPTIAAGVVYFGSGDNKVYALKASTGALLWNYSTGGVISSPPAVANGVVFVGSVDQNVYALDAKTGTKLWSYTTDGQIFLSAPAVRNGVVYVASCGIGQGGSVFALNASTGTLLWRYATGDGIQASFAVERGVIYVASADSYLYALDATTGAKLWDYLSGGFYTSSPTAANGVIYIGSAYYGSMDAIDGRIGSLLWSYTTGSDHFQYASPVVADGAMYIGSDDGTIYAFGLVAGAEAKQE
jgi:outer membrane protein assembly factor BamB